MKIQIINENDEYFCFNKIFIVKGIIDGKEYNINRLFYVVDNNGEEQCYIKEEFIIL